MPTKELREYSYNCVSQAAGKLVDPTAENNTNTVNVANDSSIVIAFLK